MSDHALIFCASSGFGCLILFGIIVSTDLILKRIETLRCPGPHTQHPGVGQETEKPNG